MAEKQDKQANEDSYTSTDTANVQLLHRETGAVLYEKEITAFRLEPETEEGARRGRALAVRRALDDGVSLAHADLSHLDLSGWDLARADFSYADLTGSDLRGSNLDYIKLTGATTTDARFDDHAPSQQLNAAQEDRPGDEEDSDRPPTAEEVAERLKDHKGITGSMSKEQLAELMEHARTVPEISGNPDALNAFKADAAAKNAAHEAYRAAWTAQVAEAFANGTATVDKPRAALESALGADPLPRSRDDIVEGSRHAAREQAAAGGSKIDQYALAMEAAQQQGAVAAVAGLEAERAVIAEKGVALEGSLGAAWAKLEAKTHVGGRAALRAAMAKARGTDAPAAAVPPREGWQEHMTAILEGSRVEGTQTPGERERAALRARKVEAQARSAQSRGFEP